MTVLVEPSNNRSLIGGIGVVRSLFLNTKSGLIKQWEDPQSIKAFTDMEIGSNESGTYKASGEGYRAAAPSLTSSGARESPSRSSARAEFGGPLRLFPDRSWRSELS